jgi:hypothetical protein
MHPTMTTSDTATIRSLARELAIVKSSPGLSEDQRVERIATLLLDSYESSQLPLKQGNESVSLIDAKPKAKRSASDAAPENRLRAHIPISRILAPAAPIAAPVPLEPALPPVEETAAAVPEEMEEPTGEATVIRLRPGMTVKQVAEAMKLRPFAIISDLMEMNVFASIHQELERSVAVRVCFKHGFLTEIDDGTTPLASRTAPPSTPVVADEVPRVSPSVAPAPEPSAAENTLKLIRSTEWVATQLKLQPELDWSVAVIGLCKAFENEIREKILEPLKRATSSIDLSRELKDQELGYVAKYCSVADYTPPDLGVFAGFLAAAMTDKTRIPTSQLLRTFKLVVAGMANGPWILGREGLVEAIKTLTRDFRNKATHLEDLAESDYHACREFVIGAAGVLWELAKATRILREP